MGVPNAGQRLCGVKIQVLRFRPFDGMVIVGLHDGNRVRCAVGYFGQFAALLAPSNISPAPQTAR